jgi:YVTN family beta-propeller protein
VAKPGLPSGTVTFLFTDIEGSTRLLHKFGQHRYDELLTAHQEILKAAFAAHEGRVVDTQGDSFFVAFRTANDAVAAAVDAQRDLAAHAWAEGAEVRVRMGLHTGEPKVGQERYVGIGVHRAARIGAAGHGGQVLLSSTTKELAEEDISPGVSIRDLGERRLKDIEQPQRLYQLVIDGLESEFGPLHTLDVELRRKRRRMYAGSALIGVLAAAVAIPVFAFAQGGSSSGVIVHGNAVAVIDPHSNQVVDGIPVGARPDGIAFGSGALWVANLDDQSVSRVDPATRSVTRTLSVVDTPTGLAASPGATWVVGSNPTGATVDVRRIDPRFDTVGRRIQIGNVVPGGPGSAAASGSTVWIAPSTGLLTRLDPNTGRPGQTIDPNAGLTAVAVGAGAAWVADSYANTVTRVDATGLLTPIAVGHGPDAIAVGAGGVWVADSLDDAVVRIDPDTKAVTTTIPVGRHPAGIAVGSGSVWVANSGDGTVTRIDPTTGKPVTTIEVGGSPQGVVVAGGRVWVTVDQQTIENTPAGSSGGTVHLSVPTDIDFMDPALAFYPESWQLLDAVCAKLVNYPDKPAPAGSLLEPEVARSLPTRSPDGKTYTFTIRKGFRFSPPSDAPVSAQTFKYSIERTLSPIMKSPAQSYLGDVVGAKAYMSGKAAHISGIVVRGNALSVHLLSPAPDLPTRLALPFFCAVPLDSPLDGKGVRVIPSAGPYYVTSYTPGQGVVLKRNPNYTGSRPHHADRIELTVGDSQQKADAEVAAGTTDYAFDGVDQNDAVRIAARYGAGSPAARKGKQQYFVNPVMNLDFIVLNTHRPLFRNVRLRQAVNYAIDRQALTHIGCACGGPELPTDQYLPPGMPGFKNVHVYPFTPNLTAARRLAGTQPRTAILYTCNTSICDQLTQIVKTNLAAIGITVVAKKFTSAALTGILNRKGEPYDLAFTLGWNADYPDPDDFLNLLLGSGATGYVPAFDNPSYQHQASAAFKLTGPPRYLAYGKLDINTARNSAPWAPIGNIISRDFFSKRIGCQVYQPVYGIDLAALCIKH